VTSVPVEEMERPREEVVREPEDVWEPEQNEEIGS
jgi:hypothetical protein